MITAYCSNCQSIELVDLTKVEALRDDIVWIDMVEPTRGRNLRREGTRHRGADAR